MNLSIKPNNSRNALGSIITTRWGKFSQKHNYEYMAKLWCLLATENYMFLSIAAIIRFWQLSCYKSYMARLKTPLYDTPQNSIIWHISKLHYMAHLKIPLYGTPQNSIIWHTSKLHYMAHLKTPLYGTPQNSIIWHASKLHYMTRLKTPLYGTYQNSIIWHTSKLHYMAHLKTPLSHSSFLEAVTV